MGIRSWIRRRRTRPPPDSALEILEEIPDEFTDDGCSGFAPEEWVGFFFGWACRIHDWRYCSRAHPRSAMRQAERLEADAELRANIRAVLPWRYRWVGWFYYVGVTLGGGIRAWDSCGPGAGDRCRHGLPPPPGWRV